MSEATISGGWLGTYAYKGVLRRKPPVRFEATLAAPSESGRLTGGIVFTGSILDDGGLGEADVRGEQSGLGVRFSKVYRTHKGSPVSYEGTLSEDGTTMSGTWRIGSTASGVWDARRAWSDSGASAAEETEEEYETPRVREVVRLG